MTPDGWGRPGDPSPGLPRAEWERAAEGPRGRTGGWKGLWVRRSRSARGGSPGACQAFCRGDLPLSRLVQTLTFAAGAPRRPRPQITECAPARGGGGPPIRSQVPVQLFTAPPRRVTATRLPPRRARVGVAGSAPLDRYARESERRKLRVESLACINSVSRGLSDLGQVTSSFWASVLAVSEIG